MPCQWDQPPRRLKAGAACALVLCFAPAVWAADPPEDTAAARTYAAAAALQNRQLYDLAADEWARFLEKHPQDARADQARYYRGVCYLQTKRYEQAAAEFRAVVVEFPQSQQLESAYYQLGLSLYRHGQANHPEAFQQAAESLALLASKYPQSKRLPAAIFYRGEALYGGGDKAAAEAEYQRFLQSFPQHELAPEALYALSVVQDENGRSGLAMETARRFLDPFAKHRLAPEMRLRLAQMLVADNQAIEAEGLFAQVASGDSAIAELALLKQAELVEGRGDWLKAAQLYDSLLDRFAQSAYRGQSQLGAGRALYRGGELAKARQRLTPLTQDPPQAETADAAHWLALVLLQEKQPAEAVALVERVLGAAGNSPGAGQLALDRADAVAAIGERRAESVALYQEMARDYPEHALAGRALYLAAFTAHQLRDFERAIALADEARARYANDAHVADAEFVAAESLLQLGRHAEAQARFAGLIERMGKSPTAPQWVLRQAWASYLDKHPREAIALLDAWSERWTDASQRGEALYLAGIARIDLNEHSAGIELLRQSWAASRDWRQADEALLALAAAEQRAGDLAAARKSVEKLLERFASSALLDRGYLLLGDIALASGDYGVAKSAYERILRQWPAGKLVPPARLGLAWSQLKLGDFAGCVATATPLVDATTEAPLTSRARYLRAVAQYELKQYPAALDDLTAVLGGAPDAGLRSDARYMQGLCLSAQGETAAAVSSLAALLADDPNYPAADRATYELAWARRAAGQANEARAAFESLAQRFPKSPLAAEARFQQGEIEYEQDHFAEAATAYGQSSELAGGSELGEKATHKQGWANFRAERYDEAREVFERQRAAWPQGALAGDVGFLLGEILFKQERWAEALAALTAAQGMSDPQFRAAALVHAAQAAAQLKEFARSRELATRCAAEFPESSHLPDALYAQAWAAQNQEESDAALALYEQVTNQTDGEVAAQARFMMGEIHFAGGQHAEAVREFFKVAYSYRYPRWQSAAHYEAGRCFEVLQKKDQARKSYQEVVDKFPQSEQSAAARERLTALGSG